MSTEHSMLFVCIHNSARSQMAETFANHYGKGILRAQSAGLEPGKLNPLVVEAMKEIGFDISHNATTSVFDLFKEGAIFHYVATVCDEAAAERCPVFPGMVRKRLHWGFRDPSALQGAPEEKLAAVREIRDEIRERIREFVRDEFGVEVDE